MITDDLTAAEGPLAREELELLHAYWRAANYLSVGQVSLIANRLLREPLRLGHLEPRLLRHGADAGVNLIVAHVKHVIGARDLKAIFVTGPGHGGRGLC